MQKIGKYLRHSSEWRIFIGVLTIYRLRYFFDRDTVVYVNDKKVSVDALVYSNTFYMKIEDIAKIANFKAKYDKNKKNVSIENVEADSSKLETKVTLGYEGIGEIEDSTGIIQPIYKGGKFVKNPKTTKDFEQLIIYMVNQGISYCNIETNQPYNDLFNYGGLIEVIEDVKFFDDYKKLEYIATFIVDANTLGKGSEITITFRGLSGQDTENYKLKKYYKKIYEVIQELISEGKLTNTMSEKEKAKVLVQWINANVEYAKEEYSTGKIKSERYTGYGALFDGLAVCEGYTRLYMSLCRSVGLYDTYYVVGTATSETTVLGAHAWTVQILDGKKVMTDPTWYNEDGDKYFAITPKEMRKDHIFDINDYLD